MLSFVDITSCDIRTLNLVAIAGSKWSLSHDSRAGVWLNVCAKLESHKLAYSMNSQNTTYTNSLENLFLYSSISK